jgi:hypothetical protein
MTQPIEPTDEPRTGLDQIIVHPRLTISASLINDLKPEPGEKIQHETSTALILVALMQLETEVRALQGDDTIRAEWKQLIAARG